MIANKKESKIILEAIKKSGYKKYKLAQDIGISSVLLYYYLSPRNKTRICTKRVLEAIKEHHLIKMYL